MLPFLLPGPRPRPVAPRPAPPAPAPVTETPPWVGKSLAGLPGRAFGRFGFLGMPGGNNGGGGSVPNPDPGADPSVPGEPLRTRSFRRPLVPRGELPTDRAYRKPYFPGATVDDRLARVEEAAGTTRERQRAHNDAVSVILNSLITEGQLTPVGNDRWSITPDGFTAPRDPAAVDDETRGHRVGQVWVNTADNSVWFCVSAAEGAAVWVEVSGTGTGTTGLSGTFP